MPIILALKVNEGAVIRRGQDYLWQVIRQLTDVDRTRPVYLDEIMQRMDGTTRSTVKLDLQRLVRAGLLENATSVAGQCWNVLKRPTKLPSIGRNGVAERPGTESMWAAMRALKTFDARELALAASTESKRVTWNTAASYLQRLNAAGYLAVVRPGAKGSGGRIAVYRLKPTMNTGPDAPKILRTKLVYDPNVGQVMGLAEAEDCS